MKPIIIFLVGPTAIGKSEIALWLAKKINGEIISCDSMQVYQDMDILTSKPALVLRRKIPHYLLDVVSPEKEYSVVKYRKEAVRKIKGIIKKGKIPLFTGGSGLYMSVVIDGIFPVKAEDKKLRLRLYQEAQKFGSPYLYNRLKTVDADAAAKIHPHDTKRIIRALEVFSSCGQPISLLQKQRRGLGDEYAVRIFCLNMGRQELYRRIQRRLEKMFRQGLLAEVKKLLKLKLSKTAHQAIGIKELKGYLDGLYDLKEAKRLIKRNTCLYAKRQLTWFRKDKRIKWIELKDKDTPRKVAEKIWKEFS